MMNLLHLKDINGKDSKVHCLIQTVPSTYYSFSPHPGMSDCICQSLALIRYSTICIARGMFLFHVLVIKNLTEFTDLLQSDRSCCKDFCYGLKPATFGLSTVHPCHPNSQEVCELHKGVLCAENTVYREHCLTTFHHKMTFLIRKPKC